MNRSSLFAALAFLAGLGWATVVFWRSPGVPLQDEIAHYLLARQAWTDAVSILDVWRKPGSTLRFMPSAAVS